MQDTTEMVWSYYQTKDSFTHEYQRDNRREIQRPWLKDESLQTGVDSQTQAWSSVFAIRPQTRSQPVNDN